MYTCLRCSKQIDETLVVCPVCGRPVKLPPPVIQEAPKAASTSVSKPAKVAVKPEPKKSKKK
jgi:DNA-directed RNA polymerase subunit RPC12/RpoP